MKEIFKKKEIQLILKVLVSTFFIGLLLVKVDWQESWQYLRRLQVWQLVIYLLVIFLSLFISTQKWQELCFFKGLKGSFLDFFRLFLTGSFINNFVPSTIGGDVYRAYQIGKKEKKYYQSSAAVVMDRFTGLLALMIMSPIFFIWNFSHVGRIYFLGAANGAIGAALVALLILWKIKKASWLKKLLEYLPVKAKIFIKELVGFGSDWKIFSRAMFYSFLFNLIGVGLANLILFWSLGIKINLLDYFSVIFLISILATLPTGIGFKEWLYMTFFAPLGISIPGAVMVAILNRFLHALVNLAALPLYLRTKK